MAAKPTNKKLYATVVAEARGLYAQFPSAYASGWIAREYKKRGGKYRENPSGPKTGISRWLAEQWARSCPI